MRRVLLLTVALMSSIGLGCSQGEQPVKQVETPVESKEHLNETEDLDNMSEGLEDPELSNETVVESKETTVPNADKTVDNDETFSVVDLIADVQNNKRSVSIFTLSEGGERMKVSGVIGEIDAYDYNLFDEVYTPQLGLESGLPEVSFAGVEEHMIECVFSKPEYLANLKIGQHVVLSGEMTWSLSLWGPKTFSMEKCQIISTEPSPGASAPTYSGDDIKAYSEEGEKLQAVYKSLDELEIDYYDLNEDDLRIDVSVPASLVDDSGHLPEAALTALNSVPIIETLDVGDNGSITNSVAIDLAKVRYCDELEIQARKLEKTGFEALLSIPGFTSLKLWYPDRLSAADFSALASIKQLRHLQIIGSYKEKLLPGTADEAFNNLKHLQELRSLEFSNVEITDKGLKVLEQLSNLREISFESCACQGSGLIHLSRPERLWDLTMTGETVTDEIAEPLKRLSNLISLDLGATMVTDKVGESFSNLTNLQTLNLYDAQVTNAIGPQLKHLKSLKILWLRQVSVDDDLILPVAELEQLSSVFLSGTQVSGNVCEQLGASKSLYKLSLTETPVDDEALKRLASSSADSTLKYLYLEKTKVTGKGLLELIPLQELKTVKVDKSLEISDEILQQLDDKASFELQRSLF